MFAELLTKVSGGDMFLDTLVFLKEFCIENEAEELYDQLLVFIRKIQESKKTKKSSELVVKPTDYSKKQHLKTSQITKMIYLAGNTKKNRLAITRTLNHEGV